MAAGSLDHTYDSAFGGKRKRLYDDEITTEHDLYSTKRRNLTTLPVRSPQRPSIAVTPAFDQCGIHTGTLTPDSIPEDNGFQLNDDHSNQHQRYRPHSDSDPSSNGSMRIDVDSNRNIRIDTDMDMDVSSSLKQIPTPLRIGRARSNDLLSPLHSPAVNMPISPAARASGRDRIPTPIASSFPTRSPFDSSFVSAAARQMRTHLQSSSLSPMIDAESWTPQLQQQQTPRTPPSPSPERQLDAPFDDGDAMMDGMEDSHMMSSSFSSLSVHSREAEAQLADVHMSPGRTWSSRTSTSPRARGLGLDGTTNMMRPDDMRMSTVGTQHDRNQSSGRTAKLHMGYKSDCEKCVARVPGHYSHILWS